MGPNIAECHGPPQGIEYETQPEQQRNKSCSIISTDFETAIRKAGFGKFNWFILLIAIPASCTTSYCTVTMSYVLPFAGQDLGLTPTKKALVYSAPYAGMICSGLMWGALSDSYGRQRLLTVGFLMDALMNTGCALFPYFSSILIFKFLSGFMVCGPYSIFMAYISEVFLDKKRELAVLSSGVFFGILQIVHVCLAMVLIPWEPPSWIPFKSWQLFIFLSGMPSLLSGVACYFCVESPKFLVETGKSEKALNVFKTIYTINTGHKADSYPVKKIHNPGEISEKKISALKKMLSATDVLKPPFIYRLFMIFGMELCTATTGNLVRLWLPEILGMVSNVGIQANYDTTLCPVLTNGYHTQQTDPNMIPTNNLYYGMIILNSFCLVTQIVFIATSKFLQKKTIMIGVASIALCSSATIPNVPAQYVYMPASITVAVLAIAFYTQINFLAEIFPTRVRATSISLNLMVGRISTLAANFLFANLIYVYCEYIFYCMSFLALGAICICLLLNTTPFDVKNSSTAIKEDRKS